MRNASILSLLLTVAAACAAAPEPLPPLVLAVGYADLGPVLGSETGGNDSIAARIEVSLFDCETSALGAPVDTRLAAVVSARGRPFRAGSTLVRGLSLPSPEDIVPSGRSATAVGIISAGFETRISAPGTGLPDFVVVRHGAALRVGLRAHEDPADRAATAGVRPPTKRGEGSGGSGADGNEEDGKGQLVLLRPLTPDSEGGVVLLRRPSGSSGAIALRLSVGAAAPEAELAAVRAELAAVAASSDLAVESDIDPSVLARQAVGARPRRHALLAVAAQYELRRCLDLLLCVEEPQLIAIAEGLPAEPASAWDIERAFLIAIVPAMQRGELSPAVGVCLRRHLGAVALDPTSLEFSLMRSAAVAEFELELLDDNLRALDARRARQRVEAAAWLARGGRAVGDFDPLAPREQRKAAIRRLRKELGQ